MSWLGRVFGRHRQKAGGDSSAIAQMALGTGQVNRQDRRMLQVYEEDPNLYSVANKIARATSSAEWGVFRVRPEARRPGDGGPVQSAYVRAKRLRQSMRSIGPYQRVGWLDKQIEDDRLEAVPDHPAIQVLERGNNFMVGMMSRFMVQLYLDLVGIVFIAFEASDVVRDTAPAQMWVFPTHFLDINGTNEAQFTFKDPKRSGAGLDMVFPSNRVIVIREPRPDDPFERSGTSFAKAVATEIAIYENGSKTANARFENLGVPSWLFVAKNLGRPALQTFRAEMIRAGGAQRNAKRAHFTNVPDLDIHRFDEPLAELALSELQDQASKVVRHAPGVNDEVLGWTENSNRASSITADRRFHADVVDPRLRLQEEVLNCHLMPMFMQDQPERERENEFILAYKSTIPDDEDFILDVTQAHKSAFSKNEARKIAGFPPHPDPINDQLPGAVLTAQQIASAQKDIIIPHAQGMLSTESAKASLQFFFGVGEDTADLMLTKPEQPATAAPPSPFGSTGDGEDEEDDEEDGDGGEGDEGGENEEGRSARAA